MRILHYSLGFPPFRTGGLVKFCTDLMSEQSSMGHQVGLLWPGAINPFSKKINIRKCKSVSGIESFEIINPNPIPYDEGIKDIKAYTSYGDYETYISFLKDVRPDLIHFHTLMGLHPAFLDAAISLGIRTVFTAHDFFSICPKVTMYRNGGICDSVESCSDCPGCNQDAIAFWKLILLQSKVYTELKDNNLIKRIRKRHKDSFYKRDSVKHQDYYSGSLIANDYTSLRLFYLSMLNRMSLIHYNSSLTANIFGKYVTIPSVVLSITHGDIKDSRRIRQYEGPLKITYLGKPSGAKGFYNLIGAIKLLEDNKDFVLNLPYKPVEHLKNVNCVSFTDYSALEEIFDQTDVLIAPSVWYETFGFTVLEAISYAVPVIVTDNVGAKDIIPKGGGIIVEANNEKALYEALLSLDSKSLITMNNCIVSNTCAIPTMKSFCDACFKELYGWDS